MIVRRRQSDARKPCKNTTAMKWAAYYLHPRSNWPDDFRLHRSARLFQVCHLASCKGCCHCVADTLNAIARLCKLKSVYLLQEYCVDAFAKVEFDRLHWVAANQEQLRSDLYQGVADAVNADDTTIGRNLGKKVLPSSFYGGPHSVAQRYQVVVTWH